MMDQNIMTTITVVPRILLDLVKLVIFGRRPQAQESEAAIEITSDSSSLSSSAFAIRNNTDDLISVNRIVSLKEGRIFSLPETPMTVAPHDFRPVQIPLGGEDIDVLVSYSMDGKNQVIRQVICASEEAE